MKTIIAVIVVLVILFFGWKMFMTNPPQDLPEAQVTETSNNPQTPTPPPSDTTNSTITNVSASSSTIAFTGYGPGKEHPTTFSWTDNLFVQNGVLKGDISFDTASVKTDSEGLDKHLCTEDFFNCAVNKTVVFTISTSTPTSVTGNLAFADKNFEVTFPVTMTPAAVMADFRLDRTPFNFKYTIANAAAVDKEVRVVMNLVLE
jgi:polyisoprenoid-binding protein YceI